MKKEITDFYQLMLENSLSADLLLDSNLRVLASNRRADQILLRFGEGTLLGREFKVSLDQSIEGLDSLLEKLGRDYLGELILIKEGGQKIFVQASVAWFELSGQRQCVLSFVDISLQRKIERDLVSKQEGLHEVLEELTKKNEELVKLDQAKTKFLALVAHELRTPLNAILSVSELLHGLIYNSDDERQQLTSTLQSQCEHLRTLVNDILDLTKIQSGKMDYFLEMQDLKLLILEVVEDFTPMARKGDISIQCIFDDVATTCYCDTVRMKQVLANLLSNALKFNRKGGVVNVNVTSKKDLLLLEVSDTGIGIPADKLESVFNPFETIESISNHHKGTGLGLPLVKSMIEAQGGAIRVTSQLGVGSTFSIELPRTQVLENDLYRSRLDFQGEGLVLFGENSES